MEKLSIKLLDSSERIPFTLTYGIHKELQTYLLDGDKIFKIYTDTEISDKIISLCLSKRNEMGDIIDEFVEIQQVSAEDITTLLDMIFEYFSDFFLKNQEKIMKLSNRLSQMSMSSETS